MFAIHDKIAETTEFHSLQQLSKEISHHIISGAVYDLDVALVDVVGDEKIPDVDVTGTFAAACASSCVQQHRVLIVLVYS